jgi:hypothetical protein
MVNHNVEKHEGFVIVPKIHAQSNPWIWRTEFFGHEPQADIILLSNGFHVAYINVQNMYGSPASLEVMHKFYEGIVIRFNLSKVTLEGFSRGGLFAFNWASRYPDKVTAIYGDNPVLDFKSWPFGKGDGQYSKSDWKMLLEIYGFTEKEAMAYKFNPIDNLEVLVAAKIPILCICGDMDSVVPFDENAGILEERYKKLGGNIKVIIKSRCNHHPHSLKDASSIVDFVIGCTYNASNVNYTREIIDYCSELGYVYGEEWRGIVELVVIGLSIMITVVIVPVAVYSYFLYSSRTEK